MCKYIFVAAFLLPALWCFAQENDVVIDSLKNVCVRPTEDTVKVNALLELGRKFLASSPQTALNYETDAKEISERIGFKRGKALALKYTGMANFIRVSFIDAVNSYQESARLCDSL